MPRRKLDPNVYVFSKNGGVITDCRFRIFSKPSRKIPIHFTQETLKIYRNIRVNAPSQDDMTAFVAKLSDMCQQLGLADIQPELIIISPYIECRCGRKTGKEEEEEAPDEAEEEEEAEADDGQEKVIRAATKLWTDAFPKYEVHPALQASRSVTVQIELVDTELHRRFVHLWKQEFGFFPTVLTKSFWYPSKALDEPGPSKLTFVDGGAAPVLPKYPIYVVSKGRWNSRLTSKFLDRIRVPYFMVVEEAEREKYEQAGVSPEKILVLSAVTGEMVGGGQTYDDEHRNDGASIPARNFAWYHSKFVVRAARHWILDDNIKDYCRMYQSQRVTVNSGACFRVLEDLVDQFDNIIVAGHQYKTFNMPQKGIAPLSLNTRVYSSILLHNDAFPLYAWRGKFNEDTDLSLRVLKDGFPTILCNVFLAFKQPTLRMTGGNTDFLYNTQDALEQKAAAIVKLHPDVACIVERFGRVHHLVDYSSFRHLRPNPVATDTNTNTNTDREYGLRLQAAAASEIENDTNDKKSANKTGAKRPAAAQSIILSTGESIPRSNKRCFRENDGRHQVLTQKTAMPVPKSL